MLCSPVKRQTGHFAFPQGNSDFVAGVRRTAQNVLSYIFRENITVKIRKTSSLYQENKLKGVGLIMELMTKEIEQKLLNAPFGSTDGMGMGAPVVVKYFNPCGIFHYSLLNCRCYNCRCNVLS